MKKIEGKLILNLVKSGSMIEARLLLQFLSSYWAAIARPISPTT
ncbi:hypothetical protein SLEP1_g56491 [Rubroshorea leprosula]|uniref:Uncharacterized protein n=1 Tax=Rubroshorea leprosula TaxID=152421 RepID=A0AAV5MLL7_9ROSI|nr:hypothetical protein SLEP1_g56491 [Rubroshorea leprosula]